ncbi:MAG: hypothetical protein JRI44_14080 [Deltaproteobacteria bacterium]|nr:hypothetical protein [Deltaproteobacteria bacterium]
MAQDGIIAILKQSKKKWFDMDQLSKELGIREESIAKSISTLRRFGMINFKYVEKGNRGYGKLVYAYKK